MKPIVILLVVLFASQFKIIVAQETPSPKHPYDSDKPVPEPKIFGEEIISTGDFESHPEFTPDGKTLYFLKDSPAFNFWTICVSHFRDGKWTAPEVAPFSGQYSDADPFITSDGAKFFFISNRPLQLGENAKGRHGHLDDDESGIQLECRREFGSARQQQRKRMVSSGCF